MTRVIPVVVCLLFPLTAWSQSKVFTNVSDETVEKALRSLDLKFKKGERKAKESTIAVYEFELDKQQYRVLNYGSDLWIECGFEAKLKLDDINRWNAQAKFSRAVVIEQKEMAAISLEAQLDCLGGVTDAIIKQFVTRFDDETKKFVKFLPKQQ